MNVQHTLATEARFKGIGLHTGAAVNMVVGPAPADSGIRFRVQPPGVSRPTVVAARIENLVGTSYCTSLGCGGVTVHTVEHLLAALAGLGVDNADVWLDAGEVPVLDGSAAPFVHGLLGAGIVPQGALRTAIRVTAPVRVEEGADKWIELAPSDEPGLTIDLDIAFTHASVGRQRLAFALTPERFVEELAAARTFGFLDEVEALRQAGLARGGSLENAVVIGREGVMNPEGLRFADELVRHKVLDLLGDFALLGRPLWGRITAHRSGHTLHAVAMQALLARPGCWEAVEAPVSEPALAGARN
jgi:UDP-3-O-[3-hydroxymyristoyl] N-acetylglucosamine deacetylase